MWIIVGGMGTLIGPVVGAFALQIVTTELGTQQVLNTYLVLGAILLVFVSLAPRGIVPLLGAVLQRLVPQRGGTAGQALRSPAAE
jgi:branched-chain amino acid transport system permease protein